MDEPQNCEESSKKSDESYARKRQWVRVWMILNIIMMDEHGYKAADFDEYFGGGVPGMDRCGRALRCTMVFVRCEPWHR
jgi:hypothetical protein